MPIRFAALPTDDVRRLQSGGPDAYGRPAERAVSDGVGVPCRHCLQIVPEGEDYLILAHRPFRTVQPYAETGPIFLHMTTCDRAPESEAIPAILSSPDYLIRGYDEGERIVYGTGAIVPTSDIPARAEILFDNPAVDFIDIRSSRNNCFQCRIVRG